MLQVECNEGLAPEVNHMASRNTTNVLYELTSSGKLGHEQILTKFGCKCNNKLPYDTDISLIASTYPQRSINSSLFSLLRSLR